MHHRAWLAALLLAGSMPHAFAQPKPVKVAVIEDKTGPLETYAKQLVTGLRLGIEYATHGTGAVAGHRIDFVEKDSQTKPDLGRDLLNEAYTDDDADIAIGGTSSAVALAMLPVAQDAKKVLIVDGAVADSITGDKWNRYIFRVDRNSSQDAVSNAVAVGKPGAVVATLAQDYAFGRDGVAAFRAALAPTGAKLVHEEYVPAATTDFTAPAQRIFDALGKQPGDKVLFVIWAGQDPMAKLAALDPGRLGIKLSTGGSLLPVLKTYNAYPSLNGMVGATYYYYGHPQEPGERLAGRRAPEAVRRPARLLHRDRHEHGDRPRHRPGEDRWRRHRRDADPGHGGHGVRLPQGADAVPRGGPPGIAADVRLLPEGRCRRPLGGSGADPHVRHRRHDHPHRQQAMTPGQVLATEGLTVRFGGQAAVDGVTCAFHPGTLTAIVGPNGAGKTTYFNLISGQLRATAGEVRLGGTRLTPLSAARRARRGLGRAFQLTNLFPDLTVLENVRLAVQARAGAGMSLLRLADGMTELSDRAAAVLDQVRLLPRARVPAAVLSHGDQRKLEVAILLAMQPAVFMFDEPTAGMSVDEVPVVLDLIEQVRSDPARTILLVEHKMDVVRRLADRVIVLHNGRLVADGDPAEVVASPIVQEAYLGVRAPAPAMPEPLLTLSGVHTHIGRYHILHGVDLVVPEGELTMLLGRNGAGKTTTLRTVMGLWRASAGTVHFAGRDITRLATPDIARLGIAYVPETMGIFTELTVGENMRLGTRSGRFDPARLEEVFALFPILKQKWQPARRRAVGRAEADAVRRPRRGGAAPAAGGGRADQGPGPGGDRAPDRRLPPAQGRAHDGAAGGAELPHGPLPGGRGGGDG